MTTYYVDNLIPDTNAASATPDTTTYNPATFSPSTGSDSAFASLSDIAALTLSAGDVVLFRKGQTFRRTSGTLTFPGGVTYGAFGSGANPRITGSTQLSTWTLDSGSVYKATCTLADHATRFMVWENGVRGTKQASQGAVLNAGDFYLDDPGNLLYYISRGGGSPASYEINVDNNHASFFFTGNNSAFSNLTFCFSGQSNLATASSAGAMTGWSFTDCRFSNAQLHGWAQSGGTPNSAGTFTRCEFDGAVNYGCVAAGPAPTAGLINTLFDTCTFHDNTLAGLSLDGPDSSTPCGNIVRNCTAYNNGGDGISIYLHDKGCIVEGCTAYNNGLAVNDRTGIKTFGQDTIIRRCKSYGNNVNYTTGHGFQSDFGAANSIFFYCVAYDNAGGGVSLTGSGHKVINCTLANNKLKASGSGAINTFGSGAFSSYEIKNNIVYNNGQTGVPGSRYQVYDPGHLGNGTHSFDNNVYFDTEAHSNLMYFNSVLYASLAAFVAAKSIDVHSMEVNPAFSDSATVFNLSNSSPARRVGVLTSLHTKGVTTDYAGNVISDPPDVGYLDNQSAYSPPSTPPTARTPRFGGAFSRGAFSSYGR